MVLVNRQQVEVFPLLKMQQFQLEIAYSASSATGQRKTGPWGGTWIPALCTAPVQHFDPKPALLFSYLSKPHLQNEIKLFRGRIHHIE